jgi:hypothetical protein
MTESAGLKIVKTFEIEKDKSLCIIAEKTKVMINVDDIETKTIKISKP